MIQAAKIVGRARKDQEHQTLRPQRGRNAGADNSERRHAKLAKHQDVVGEGVEGYGDQAGDQGRTRPLKRRKDAAGGDEQKVGQQTPLITVHVDSGVVRKVGRFADSQQNPLRLPEVDPSDERERRRP